MYVILNTWYIIHKTIRQQCIPKNKYLLNPVY